MKICRLRMKLNIIIIMAGPTIGPATRSGGWSRYRRDMITASIDRKIALTEQINQSHFRSSMKDVTGYTIQATDGEIGEVHDFIVDDEPWVILLYDCLDTGNWWPGKRSWWHRHGSPTWTGRTRKFISTCHAKRSKVGRSSIPTGSIVPMSKSSITTTGKKTIGGVDLGSEL